MQMSGFHLDTSSVRRRCASVGSFSAFAQTQIRSTLRPSIAPEPLPELHRHYTVTRKVA